MLHLDENKHFLQLDSGVTDTNLEQLPAKGWKQTIEPEVLVIHYGVTHSLDTLVAAQKAQNFWAHISHDAFVKGSHGAWYEIRQHVAFNKRGSHAGKSHWNGKDAVNGFSIGIEIANPGPLVERKNGKLYTTYGKEWPRDEAVNLEHKNGRSPYEWWAIFTNQEIDFCLEMSFLLKKELGLVDVVGHDEIAPYRKIDPGPAFPMEWLREQVYGRSHILGENP